MTKKIKNILKNELITVISLCALTFVATISPMEPTKKSRELAAKSAAQQTYQTKKQQEKDDYATESSDEECAHEASSEYSYEEIAPQSFKPQPFKLAEYNNTAGSVLPLYTGPNKKKYVILTREARGKDKRKYDDFSGGREREDKHPMLSAAREFWEEAILERILGWNLSETINFINPKSAHNTIVVVAYSKDKNPKNPKSVRVRNVTYIVDFDKYAEKLFTNFYSALVAAKKYYREHHIPRKDQSTTEKDKIAGVLLDDLKDAIINSKNQRTVRVQANVLNPRTNRFYNEQITLRPFLVSKLRSYFLGVPYEQGENTKIRHYKSYH